MAFCRSLPEHQRERETGKAPERERGKAPERARERDRYTGFFLGQNGSSVLPKFFWGSTEDRVSLSIRAPHSCVLIRQEDMLINSITIDQNRTRVRL